MKPEITLADKKVLVVGLARTGIATAMFCAARGAHVTATDEIPESQIGEIAVNLRKAGVDLEFGGHRAETFERQDLIIASPGVPLTHPAFAFARAKGIPIWSEIELAWRFLHGRLICITGSNGKTTTTSLVGHILESAGFAVQVAGNIGIPLISLVDASVEAGFTVLEASSFQLESIAEFRPDIAVLLNLTPDHMDRHVTFENYGRAKARIFENQTERDSAVINADDPMAMRHAPMLPNVFWFSRQKQVANGCFLKGNEIVFRRDGSEASLLRRQDIQLRGEHNVENVLAAATAATIAGVEPAAIAQGVRTFAGVEHRIEFVATISGVDYFNDSKATNVDATLKALESFSGNELVILGGKDKGSDYTVLREPLRKRAKMAILIGAAAEKIEKELDGVLPVKHAGTMVRAVELAAEHSLPGDIVLLAPACASFDQFENFEDRGRVFKKLVQSLQERDGARDDKRAAVSGTPRLAKHG